MDRTYQSSPIKRRPRRTKAQIGTIQTAIVSAAGDCRPATVRQIYYRLVTLGVIDKTEAEYDTVQRLLVALRRMGAIPYSWIADGTRWQRKPKTYSSLGDMLDQQQRFFRRAIWEDQDAYVEVWLEKDALAGVVYQVTAEYDVPLMVTRGFASLSFLHNAACDMDDEDKPVHIYYLGDHDPSGVDIPRKVEASLREFAPEMDLTFTRLAVTAEQITEFGLVTRPTKQSDSRAKNFEGESVEVDAISPDELRALVRGAIESHIDHDYLDRTRRIEAAERDTLTTIIEGLAG